MGQTTSRRGRTLVPLIGQLRAYDRRGLRGDLVAGVAVAALIVPKNLGYAGIAAIGAYPGGIDTDMLAGVDADKAALKKSHAGSLRGLRPATQ
jgi:hypothetical protein